LKLVTESAIKPGIARARGYRTITTKAELERCGFAQVSALRPPCCFRVADFAQGARDDRR
jgi:hypothetical protein